MAFAIGGDRGNGDMKVGQVPANGVLAESAITWPAVLRLKICVK